MKFCLLDEVYDFNFIYKISKIYTSRYFSSGVIPRDHFYSDIGISERGFTIHFKNKENIGVNLKTLDIGNFNIYTVTPMHIAERYGDIISMENITDTLKVNMESVYSRLIKDNMSEAEKISNAAHKRISGTRDEIIRLWCNFDVRQVEPVMIKL